jgi:hypothetical protein
MPEPKGRFAEQPSVLKDLEENVQRARVRVATAVSNKTNIERVIELCDRRLELSQSALLPMDQRVELSSSGAPPAPKTVERKFNNLSWDRLIQRTLRCSPSLRGPPLAALAQDCMPMNTLPQTCLLPFPMLQDISSAQHLIAHQKPPVKKEKAVKRPSQRGSGTAQSRPSMTFNRGATMALLPGAVPQVSSDQREEQRKKRQKFFAELEDLRDDSSSSSDDE